MFYKNRNGFTLIELVITILIVVILSTIAVPVYKGHLKKAKLAEGYALLGRIVDSQLLYYSEYKSFIKVQDIIHNGRYGYYTCYAPILEINARTNKYFTLFCPNNEYYGVAYMIRAFVTSKDAGALNMEYNLTSGVTIS